MRGRGVDGWLGLGGWMMGLGNAALSLKILCQITTHFEMSSTGGSSWWLHSVVDQASRSAVYATNTTTSPFYHLLPCWLPPAHHPLSLPLNLTACPYFCSFVISPSPCLTTSAYCLFLSSGLLVSMILLTRSMVQGMRSAAMNFAKSL